MNNKSQHIYQNKIKVYHNQFDALYCRVLIFLQEV